MRAGASMACLFPFERPYIRKSQAGAATSPLRPAKPMELILERAGISMQTVSARDWATILRRYREPSHTRSVFELMITAGCFVLLWVLMWTTLDRLLA